MLHDCLGVVWKKTFRCCSLIIKIIIIIIIVIVLCDVIPKTITTELFVVHQKDLPSVVRFVKVSTTGGSNRGGGAHQQNTTTTTKQHGPVPSRDDNVNAFCTDYNSVAITGWSGTDRNSKNDSAGAHRGGTAHSGSTAV